jgi:CRP/FNR family cyclic AMP-dependent transcriptional regulator
VRAAVPAEGSGEVGPRRAVRPGDPTRGLDRARPCWFTDPVDIPKVLQLLGEQDARLLVRASSRTTYARRELLVREGEPADSFHVILEGRAAVRVTTSAGESAIVTVLGPDSHFGEVSLLGRGAPRRTADVLALERVTTLAVPAAMFHSLRKQNPELERFVSAILAQRVRELSGQLVEAMYDSLGRRVVTRLLALAEAAGTSATEVVLPLTQTELSQLAGGSRPSVNQALQRLAADGLVEVRRGRVTVRDVPGLRRRLEA